MTPTDEQAAIIAEARTGKGDILIDALAGTGKTFALLECVKVLPQKSILFAAFNRGIAEEASARAPGLPKGSILVVQTFHAIGRQILFKHYPRLSIDKTATEGLVNDACARVQPGAPYEVKRSATRLLRAAKEALPPWETKDDRYETQDMSNLGFDLGLFSPKLSSAQIEVVIRIAVLAVHLGLDIDKRTIVDFCDLVWLPLALRLDPPSRYQAIILDEVQDISAPQWGLIQRLRIPQTRIIAAGDEWQQIYGWRGSLGRKIFDRLAHAKRLPLTMTWRCSKAVVKAANELVPALRHRPDAEDGSVATCTLGELPFRIAQGYADGTHTFVLSRTNMALLDCALFLWRASIKFMLNAGQSLLDPLFNLLDRELDLHSEAGFRRSLAGWHIKEAAKADKAGATSRREQIDEQRYMLLAALRYAPPRKIKGLLRAMLVDNKSGVLLSTVHKVKGLEAERVFLLRQTFARHAEQSKISVNLAEQMQGLLVTLTPREEDVLRQRFGVNEVPRQSVVLPVANQEEFNLEYVAITRAKTNLCWVDIKDKDQPKLLELDVEDIEAEDLDAALILNERALQQAQEAGNEDQATAYAVRCDAILGRLPRRAW